MLVVRALPRDCPLLTDGGTRGPQPSSSSQASAPQAPVNLANKHHSQQELVPQQTTTPVYLANKHHNQQEIVPQQ